MSNNASALARDSTVSDMEMNSYILKTECLRDLERGLYAPYIYNLLSLMQRF